ncbi:MAG: hypothetical protein WD557_06655 [Dehalococcoidia bacterium]
MLATSLPRPFLPLAIALLAILAAIAAGLASPGKSEAKSVWCSGDPAIIVNGSVVSITAHMPLDRLRDIDHVEFVFHVPSNAKVTAVINDSVLFKAKIIVKKDLPAARGLFGTPVVVDMTVQHEGDAFPVAVTTIVVGKGTKLWTEGTSSTPLTVRTTGLLNLRLF